MGGRRSPHPPDARAASGAALSPDTQIFENPMLARDFGEPLLLTGSLRNALKNYEVDFVHRERTFRYSVAKKQDRYPKCTCIPLKGLMS
jgi:hypothetical protein